MSADRENRAGSPWPLRSMLFVPGNRPDLLAKIDRFRPDATLLDLEDAVPPQGKDSARQTARQAIASFATERGKIFVRINPLDEGGISDLQSIVMPGLCGVVLPKVASTAEVTALDRLLTYEEGRSGIPMGTVRVLPLPETAAGLNSAAALASASDRVDGLIGVISGAIPGDVARAVGFRPTAEGEEQAYLSSKIVLDSRASGARYPMASIIGMQLGDHDTVRRLIKRAKNFGFAGVLLIHPSHIAIAHEIFAPTAEEVAFFEEMITTYRTAADRGEGVIVFRGVMVDQAMAQYAESMLGANHAMSGKDRQACD
jgi:citrate lyase subunit beta/citryl-CoA lyase